MAHPLPAAAVAALAAYGSPHAAPIYVPASHKDVEHWVAFVGGDAALSAWLVTPSDPAHLLVPVAGWPVGVRVTGGVGEIGDRGLDGGEVDRDAANAYVLVESRAGMGQAAGLRGGVRIAINAPPDAPGSVVMNDRVLLALSGVTDAAAIGPRLDALAADVKAVYELLPANQLEAFATYLSSWDAAAGLIPRNGVVLGDLWQYAFIAPDADVPAPTTEVAELQGLIVRSEWFCAWTACTDGVQIAVLGVDEGHLVVRAMLRQARGPAPTADEPRAVATPRDPAEPLATARALGLLDAKVLAAGATPRGWTAVVATGDSAELIARDGDLVAASELHLDEPVAPQLVRFVDIDGDGLAEVALPHRSATGEPYTTFRRADGSSDVGAGIAAIGARTPDDAIARALAIPAYTLVPDEACAVLTRITSASSLAKEGRGTAVVYAFTEPGQPEVRHERLGQDAAAALHATFKDGCRLVCDPRRPICHTTEEGPGVTYHLFALDRTGLGLVAATVYRGS